MAKERRINARITKEQHNKLMSHISNKGMTISQWIAERIDLMRVKKGG